MTTELSSKPRRRIVFVSGTRADFGKLKPLMEAVEASDDFVCSIFATGMHMLSRYGRTLLEIQRSGFTDIFQYINQLAHTSCDMDIVLASTIQGVGHYAREHSPDMIVVHGDRVEALAGAIVGALNNILVAHVEGGELSGTVDELIRHAVSKMSHVHFVANEDARKRLIQLGEQETSIFVIGSPDIDVMFSDRLPAIEKVRARYEIPFEDYGILMYHPVTTELDKLQTRVECLLDAVIESGWNFVVIYPNNDPGSDLIIERFERLRKLARFRVLPSLRFEYFLTLLRHTRGIIGNSSAGIREAPAYCVPTLDIGTRQQGRFTHPSIIHVPDNKAAIGEAISNLCRVETPSFHFGAGTSAKSFLESLQREGIWEISCQKRFRDL